MRLAGDIEPRCCSEPLTVDGLERLRAIYKGILDAEHGRDGKENAIRVLFATIDADRVELQRLRGVETRAKQAARPFNDLRGSEPSPEVESAIRVARFILGEEGSQTK
jgi:hypothetical protein